MKTNLYEQDFFAWTQEQAQLLSDGSLSRIDVGHLIEELKLMGATEKRELSHRLEILLMHLLKWKYQSSKRTTSWELTIKEQRKKLKVHLRDNPSLKNPDTFSERLFDAYDGAILKAAKETKLSYRAFPEVCEWSIEQILADDFYPN